MRVRRIVWKTFDGSLRRQTGDKLDRLGATILQVTHSTWIVRWPL